MKRIFIAGTLAMLVAAGAAAAWLLPHGRGEAAEGELPDSGDVIFVDLDTVVLPVFRAGRLIQHLTLGITLEVPADRAERVAAVMPRLRDAYLTELHGMFSLRFVQDRESVLPLVKRRLLVVSERELGTGAIRDVLVQSMEQRRRVAR
jgi:hypothetical protein